MTEENSVTSLLPPTTHRHWAVHELKDTNNSDSLLTVEWNGLYWISGKDTEQWYYSPEAAAKRGWRYVRPLSELDSKRRSCVQLRK